MKTAPQTLLAVVMLAMHPASLPAAPAPLVSLVDIRPLPGWKGDPAGNVSITTPDGKHLQLTRGGCARQPKASPAGLVGWIDCSEPGEPGTIRMVKGVPIGSRLVLRGSDGSLLTISAGKPIIEAWGFDPDGFHVVLKSRALHGPALIERYRMRDGSRAGCWAAYGAQLPKWASAYSD